MVATDNVVAVADTAAARADPSVSTKPGAKAPEQQQAAEATPSDAVLVAETARAREAMFAAADRAGLSPEEANQAFQAAHGCAAVWGTAEQLCSQTADLLTAIGASA
ncbi:hypothetical protein ACFVT1_16550 [Streptomyces sp. NPDC057963]|uniref:hypothetical protein n=1 Tax=Streptomyces sp. NPDC057963 TaxID=3346290 RepID=UPI0036E8E9E6